MKKKPKKKYYRDDKFLRAIGHRIRQCRLSHKMTQKQLAFACNKIDFTQIGKMERGEVNFTVSYLLVLAKAMRIQPSDLLPLPHLK